MELQWIAAGDWTPSRFHPAGAAWFDAAVLTLPLPLTLTLALILILTLALALSPTLTPTLTPTPTPTLTLTLTRFDSAAPPPGPGAPGDAQWLGTGTYHAPPLSPPRQMGPPTDVRPQP